MRVRQSNSGKAVDGNWHERRFEARRHAYSAEEFSEQERVDYNLDGTDADPTDLFGRVNPYPGDITGEHNPETWRNTGDRRHRTYETILDRPEI